MVVPALRAKSAMNNNTIILYFTYPRKNTTKDNIYRYCYRLSSEYL